MQVAVAILNWNGKELLQKFLPEVVRTSSPHTVAVIDNASEDGSVQWMKEHHPEVQLIENKENLGFAGGYNEGLKSLDTDIIVLLNSDVEVTENWLDPLIEEFVSNEKVAACQPKILDQLKKSHFEYAGACGGFLDRYGYPYCRGRVFDTLEADSGQYDTPMDVHWASGACLAIRKEIYESMGGLDEDLFAHMEEIDLCWRIRRHGLRVRVIPSSVVYHMGGATLSGHSPYKSYLNFRNNLIMILKNDRSGTTLWLIWVRMVMDALSFLRFIAQGRGKHAWAVLKAHRDFYGTLSKTLSKRRKLGRAHAARSNFSAVWWYFGKKRERFDELPHPHGTS